MISSIQLKNFRSYTSGSFEFEPGVNIIVGPNASGKTNLLEAILTLCRGGSYRARDIELIMFNKPWARIDGFFEKQNRSVKLIKDPETDKIDKQFVIDAKSYKRLGLDKTVAAVLFEPNHLQLIIRGPETRRDYFDDLLARSQPGFKTLSANYKRALTQRNWLLKLGASHGSKQIFVWDVRLSELGENIAKLRQQLVDDINKEVAKSYGHIAGSRTKLSLEYQSQFKIESYASQMLSKLGASVDRDYQRGFTAYGPHREDFIFNLASKNATTTASRGETRSIVLSLKVFELGLIERVRGQKPIFLLDDVFSELDGARRRSLVDFLKKYQTIITTTDADAVLEYFARGQQKLISLK